MDHNRACLGNIGGFGSGFISLWIGVLGFDLAFTLGFVRHASESTTNAIFAVAGALALLLLLIAVMQRKFLAWLCGFFACSVAMFLGLWSLTGSAVRVMLP
jgi:hypothetical protein